VQRYRGGSATPFECYLKSIGSWVGHKK